MTFAGTQFSSGLLQQFSADDTSRNCCCLFSAKAKLPKQVASHQTQVLLAGPSSSSSSSSPFSTKVTNQIKPEFSPKKSQQCPSGGANHLEGQRSHQSWREMSGKKSQSLQSPNAQMSCVHLKVNKYTRNVILSQ